MPRESHRGEAYPTKTIFKEQQKAHKMNSKNAIDQSLRSVTNTYDGVQKRFLDRLGLEPKRSTFELTLLALGIFGAGMAAGTALGVMLAPKRGEELRKDIKHRVSDLHERGVEQLEDVRSKGEELVESARSLTGSIASSAKAELSTTSKPEIATKNGVSRLP